MIASKGWHAQQAQMELAANLFCANAVRQMHPAGRAGLS
jgi:hypothetical protein